MSAAKVLSPTPEHIDPSSAFSKNQFTNAKYVSANIDQLLETMQGIDEFSLAEMVDKQQCLEWRLSIHR